MGGWLGGGGGGVVVVVVVADACESAEMQATTICVLMLMYVSSYYCMCPHTTVCVSSYLHTTIFVSAYCYIYFREAQNCRDKKT